MTQLELALSSAPVRPLTATDRVAALFRSRPNEWISAFELEEVGGRLAWRTEVSRCHTQLGMTIEKRLDREHGKVVRSWRRWVPAPSQAVA